MDKEEILQKAGQKKPVMGEMEKQKLGKSTIVGLLVAGIIAVAFIIVEGALGHFSAVYAIACICFSWPMVFYTMQFFVAKMPWQVLIGTVLDSLAFIFFLVRFILCVTGVWL